MEMCMCELKIIQKIYPQCLMIVLLFSFAYFLEVNIMALISNKTVFPLFSLILFEFTTKIGLWVSVCTKKNCRSKVPLTNIHTGAPKNHFLEIFQQCTTFSFQIACCKKHAK